MWPHFQNLLWASSWAALANGSSTWISFLILSVGAVFLSSFATLYVEWYRGGRTMNAFTKAWKQWPTYVIPPFTVIVLWVGIFAWSIVKTVYDDHTTLVQQRDKAIENAATKRKAEFKQPLSLDQMDAQTSARFQKMGATYAERYLENHPKVSFADAARATDRYMASQGIFSHFEIGQREHTSVHVPPASSPMVSISGNVKGNQFTDLRIMAPAGRTALEMKDGPSSNVFNKTLIMPTPSPTLTKNMDKPK